MPNLLRVSEAASLALHAMVFVAGESDGPVSTPQIAESLAVSEAHLSKVLQRLAQMGLVRSVRGPKGGFVLARPDSKITLLNVYEAIEGRLTVSRCLFAKPVCNGHCILGGLLGEVNQRVRDHLAKTTLSQLHDVYGSQHEHH